MFWLWQVAEEVKPLILSLTVTVFFVGLAVNTTFKILLAQLFRTIFVAYIGNRAHAQWLQS